jgi:chemotaxis signal transduction protein
VSGPALPVPRLVPRDPEALERRAAALAAGAAAGTDQAPPLQVVAFRLGGARCAVEAAVVERAVARLAGAIPVPRADGTERALTFVEERPLPLLDLAGHVAGGARRAAALVGRPALVIATGGGSVAVAVDGPLELAEDRLAEVAAGDPGAGPVRLAGRLAGGEALVDAAWLAGWAGEAGRA